MLSTDTLEGISHELRTGNGSVLQLLAGLHIFRPMFLSTRTFSEYGKCKGVGVLRLSKLTRQDGHSSYFLLLVPLQLGHQSFNKEYCFEKLPSNELLPSCVGRGVP